MKIIALVPAYNEADAVSETVKALLDLPSINGVIVIDDASTDSTAETAERAGAQVVRLARNAGKGGALNQGLRHIPGDADMIALVDADVGRSSSEVEKLAAPVISGDADMSIAVIKPKPGSGGFGLVKNIAARGIKERTGMDFIAPLSGQRVMRKAVIDAVGHFDEGFGLEVALTIDAVKNKFKVVEIPVDMYHAYTGKTLRGFLHRGKQYRDVRAALKRR